MELSSFSFLHMFEGIISVSFLTWFTHHVLGGISKLDLRMSLSGRELKRQNRGAPCSELGGYEQSADCGGYSVGLD